MGAAAGLVHHDAGVGQGKTLARRAGGEQQAAGGGGHADADGADGAADVLHRVVHRQGGRDHAAGAVDVERDVLVRVLAFQEQQLGADQRCHAIIDLTGQEDNAFLQQARIDVVRPLATRGLLDHHRHEVIGIDLKRISITHHLRTFLASDLGF